jgi:hypothetical protein
MDEERRNRIICAAIDVSWWLLVGILVGIIIGGGIYLLIWLTRGGFWA